MTFATVESAATQNLGANSVNHNVTMDATVNSGDGLVVSIIVNSNTTFTTPLGWTSEVQRNDAVPSCRVAVFKRVADGTEGGTSVNFITASSCGGTVHKWRLSNWWGVLDGIESSSSNGADPPSLTPSWGALDTTFFAIVADDTTSWSG